MRRSSWFLIFVCLFGCMPLFAHAASVLQPIINFSNGACTCSGAAGSGSTVPSAPDWGCVLQTIQTGINDVVAFASIIITLYIAWAGFAFILSPTSAEGRQKARQRIVNAVIGLVVVLCAWLLVDSIMKVVYNSSASGTGVASLGPWNSILSDSGDQCIKPVTSSPQLPGLTAASNAGGGTLSTTNNPPATTGSGSTGTPTQNSIGDCSASALKSTFGNNSEAMSCVTHYEDGSCNLGAPSGTDKGADGNSVSFGMFQVNISANNLSQYPACEAAVNNQPLNCKQAFTGGAYTASNHSTTVSNQSLYSTCISAVSNAACNEQAGQNILNTQGIGAWGSAAQNNCSSLLGSG